MCAGARTDWLRMLQAPGQLEQLSHGRCHYVRHGNTDDPLVVMLHGTIGTSEDMRALSDSLVLQGRQTLRIDLYGRLVGVRFGHHFVFLCLPRASPAGHSESLYGQWAPVRASGVCVSFPPTGVTPSLRRCSTRCTCLSDK